MSRNRSGSQNKSSATEVEELKTLGGGFLLGRPSDPMARIYYDVMLVEPPVALVETAIETSKSVVYDPTTMPIGPEAERIPTREIKDKAGEGVISERIDEYYQILDDIISKQVGYRQDPEKEIPTNRERMLSIIRDKGSEGFALEDFMPIFSNYAHPETGARRELARLGKVLEKEGFSLRRVSRYFLVPLSK